MPPWMKFGTSGGSKMRGMSFSELVCTNCLDIPGVVQSSMDIWFPKSSAQSFTLIGTRLHRMSDASPIRDPPSGVSEALHLEPDSSPHLFTSSLRSGHEHQGLEAANQKWRRNNGPDRGDVVGEQPLRCAGRGVPSNRLVLDYPGNEYGSIGLQLLVVPPSRKEGTHTKRIVERSPKVDRLAFVQGSAYGRKEYRARSANADLC